MTSKVCGKCHIWSGNFICLAINFQFTAADKRIPLIFICNVSISLVLTSSVEHLYPDSFYICYCIFKFKIMTWNRTVIRCQIRIWIQPYIFQRKFPVLIILSRIIPYLFRGYIYIDPGKCTISHITSITAAAFCFIWIITKLLYRGSRIQLNKNIIPVTYVSRSWNISRIITWICNRRIIL